MIFLVQFGINKHLLIFSKTTILLVFKKIYSFLFIPNCPRNHVITYTNKFNRDKSSWTILTLTLGNLNSFAGRSYFLPYYQLDEQR